MSCKQRYRLVHFAGCRRFLQWIMRWHHGPHPPSLLSPSYHCSSAVILNWLGAGRLAWAWTWSCVSREGRHAAAAPYFCSVTPSFKMWLTQPVLLMPPLYSAHFYVHVGFFCFLMVICFSVKFSLYLLNFLFQLLLFLSHITSLGLVWLVVVVYASLLKEMFPLPSPRKKKLYQKGELEFD